MASLLLSAGTAAAQSAGCLDLANQGALSFTLSSTETVLTNQGFDEGDEIFFPIFSFGNSFPFPNTQLTDGAGNDIPGATTSDVFGLAMSTTTVGAGGLPGLGIYSSIGGTATINGIEISCSMPGAAQQAFEPIVNNLAAVASTGQQRTLASAVDNTAAARLRGADDVTTRNGALFFSTSHHEGANHVDASAWFALDTRAYFDAVDGHSADIAVGIDTLVQPGTLIGFTLGVGKSDIEDSAGSKADSTAFSFGVYGAHDLNGSGIILSGYASRASIDYDTGASEFETDRTIVGLGLSGPPKQGSMGTLSPRARIWSSWEDFPTGTAAVAGGTTRQVSASVGRALIGPRHCHRPICSPSLRLMSNTFR